MKAQPDQSTPKNGAQFELSFQARLTKRREINKFYIFQQNFSKFTTNVHID